MLKERIRYGLYVILIILLAIYLFHKKDVQAVDIVDGIENFHQSY